MWNVEPQKSKHLTYPRGEQNHNKRDEEREEREETKKERETIRFLGGYKTASVTCVVVAISIYVAFSFTKSPVNRTDAEDYMKRSMYSAMPEDEESELPYSRLEFGYYHASCPLAERLIRNSVKKVYKSRPAIAPSLIRLLFHNCFIEGCDASVLLDADESQTSEKEAAPNLTLRGFEVIDAIKSDLENICPGIVSCSDILAVATKEAVELSCHGTLRLVVQVITYKLEGEIALVAFKNIAEQELPSPRASLSVILARFASRGFNQQETVSLLGAHSVGITHCTFFDDRIYNFSGTGKPDPELNPDLLKGLRRKCPFSGSSSSPSVPEEDDLIDCRSSSENTKERTVDLSFGNEGGRLKFGTRYFKRLLENKVHMFSDQQLMSKEETAKWVRKYASNPLEFHRDFAMAMVKLSTYHVLTDPLGQIRSNCSLILP
ncbi:unnamed protein product [Microthlaspi erraticum]|uniref:peroxidase n=1 Tax=Microthlaspi erraticum TaxID=1685480 RepID=A0A6D2HHN8_9BRAS|nr:unnamed protein product [Microthlaspi erraticum]